MKRLFYLAACLLCLAGCNQFKPEVSVMTFNIRLSPYDTFDGEYCWPNRRAAAMDMIRDIKPDFFGIQEGIFSQVNYIEESLPEYGRYGVGRDDGAASGEANAIFWLKDRFDLVECQTFWLSATPDSVSRGWDGACNRVVTWGHFLDKKAGNRDVYFFNTHFDHIGKIAREESGKLIIERMKTIVPEGAPVFLTGDFNANYDDYILDPVREFMGMSREVAAVSDTLNTFHNWGTIDNNTGESIIDHIFYKNAAPLKYKTITEQYGVKFISDHYPAVSVFEY